MVEQINSRENTPDAFTYITSGLSDGYRNCHFIRYIGSGNILSLGITATTNGPRHAQMSLVIGIPEGKKDALKVELDDACFSTSGQSCHGEEAIEFLNNRAEKIGTGESYIRVPCFLIAAFGDGVNCQSEGGIIEALDRIMKLPSILEMRNGGAVLAQDIYIFFEKLGIKPNDKTPSPPAQIARF